MTPECFCAVLSPGGDDSNVPRFSEPTGLRHREHTQGSGQSACPRAAGLQGSHGAAPGSLGCLPRTLERAPGFQCVLESNPASGALSPVHFSQSKGCVWLFLKHTLQLLEMLIKELAFLMLALS